jgi:hypothetical protein
MEVKGMNEKVRDEVLRELRLWVDSDTYADDPFIEAGEKILSPRGILEEVEQNSPLGQAFVEKWLELAAAT